MFTDSRILVTGGAGFIGSALVWALNKRGHSDIVISDRLAHNGSWRNLVPLQFSDYIDADDLLGLVERGSDLGGVQCVFHFGACSSTTERNAGFLLSNNFDFTRRLSLWAIERGIRFVYASSASTYGDGSRGMDDLDNNLTRLRPLNPYAYSKHLFDLYAMRHGYLDRIIGIKYFNVFGPNEDHKGDMRSLVPKALSEIEATGRVCLFKSYRGEWDHGCQERDFIYIKDAVEIALHLGFSKEGHGLFNAGTGISHTWVELANAVFAAIGREPEIDFIEMPEGLRKHYQYSTRAEIGKLLKSGYNISAIPLAEAVRDYVINYLQKGLTLGAYPENEN